MTSDPGTPPGSRRRRAWPVWAGIGLAALFLVGAWLVTRVVPRPEAAPGRTTPRATLVRTFTAATPSSSAPSVLHPTIRDLAADVDDAGGSITFRLTAALPAGLEVADVLLWYDTVAGHSLKRMDGALSNPFSLAYRLDVSDEGFTRTLTSSAELDYWWLVRDTSGESARSGATAILGPNLLARTAASTRGVPPAGFSWSVSDTLHYSIHYAAGTASERDLPQIGAVAEATFRRTRQALGSGFDGQMGVFLVPRVFWQGAATYGGKVQLISYLDRNYTGIKPWSYFAHEGAHALAQDLLLPNQEGDPDGVLVEGLAVWAVGGHYGLEPVDAWAATSAASEGYIPLSKLRSGPFYDFQHETSYLEAGSFVRFLVESYGWERMRELYGRSTGNAEHDEELVGRLYGRSYSSLESDWLTYLRDLAPLPEEAQKWNLTVRFFDLMRRYEAELDPDARILPEQVPSEWTSSTLQVFLRQKRSPANAVLETALIAAQERLKGGDPGGAAALLDDVEASLDAGGRLTRPALEARLAILGVVAEQDRAMLRADMDAYLGTWVPSYSPPPTLTEALQLPFTSYCQEVVRLDVADDGQSAQGVVVVHAEVDGGEFPEGGRLFAVRLLLREGQWRMASREPTWPALELPPWVGSMP